MKSHKNRAFFSLPTGIALFWALMVVTGCGQTREPKTMLLPDTEQEEQNALQGEAPESYTVKKIYTQEYNSGVPEEFTAFLPGAKEHQVTLLQKSDDDGLNLISMDYRYGFYEPRYTVSRETLFNSDWWTGAGKEGSRLLFGEFSPDGRYFLYIRYQTYTGEKLYLQDLESGEEMLLLDGDVQECPGDEFEIMTAWDVEDSLLCYGFYPENQDVWMNNPDQCVFHFMDLEKKKEVSSLNYSYAELYAKPEDLRKTGIAVDRDGEELLTAIISEMEGTDGVWIDFYQQKLLEDNNEQAAVAVNPVPIIHDKKLNVRPDAKNQCFYGTYTDGSQGGILYGDFQTQWDDQLTGASITDYLVLDDGKTIITAENPSDQIEQEICLYTKNGDDYIRHLLYKGNGNMIRLQYDPVYHRLLAELGDMDTINGSLMDGERGLVILEFE